MKKLISLLLVLTLSLSLVGGLGITALASGEAADMEAEAAPAAEAEAIEDTGAETAPEAVPETEAPAPDEAETDAPAAEDAATEPEDTALPELFSAEALPEEELIAGIELQETASEDALAAGESGEEESSSYQAANNFVAGQNYILVADGKAIANNSGTIEAVEPKLDGSDASAVWVASAGKNGTKLTNGGVNFYYNTEKTAAATTAEDKGNWNYSGGKLYYEGQGKIYVSGVNESTVTLSTSDGCAVTIYTDGADPGTASGSTGGAETDPGSTDSTDSTGSADSGTSVQYDAANELAAGMNVAFAVGGFTFGVDRGSLYVGAAAVADGKLTVETSNWIQVVENGAGGLALVVEDPPGETTYLSIDASGLKSEKTSAIPGGSWAYADGHLSYTADGVTYYITGASESAVATGTDAGQAAAVTLYTGTEEPQKAPPPDSSEPADDAAPIITRQPEAVPYVIEGSGYDAPTYTVAAQLPADSESRSIYFQWYLDGGKVGEELKIAKDSMTDGTASSTITVEGLKDKTAGLYRVCCEVWCNTNGGPEKHSVNSFTVSFLVCKGVKSNSFITFSDVHETFDNVGTAIYDTMMVNEGYIPALIICTGDWANGSYMGEGAGSDNYNATMDDYIARLRAQAAGIDTIFISGNHDNGAAAADATAAAGLGAEEGYDGLGVAYDSRTAENAGSSQENTGLIVFGINYDQLQTESGGYSYAKVIPALESFFQELEKDYNGELVVISAHAGLHVLGKQTGSSASEWSGGSEYNVDKSDEVVSLLNQYGQTMDIMFFFGHDHSKSEAELFLKPGDTITSTTSYADRTFKEQTISFSYGHAGYITNTIGGEERYSQVSWDDEVISRVMAIANDNPVNELTYDIDRAAEPAREPDATPEPSPTPEPEPESKVQVAGLDGAAVTPDLKAAGFETAAAIGDALKLKVEDMGFAAGDTALFDVKLMILEGGQWVEATPENFPKEGVRVVFEYPEGTNARDYEFTVIHMFGSNINGKKAGDIEVLQPVLTEDGIAVTVTSLSPFAVSWKAVKTPAGNNGAGSTNNTATTKSTTPKTGDESSPVLWAAVLVLCAGGAAALLPRRKRN